MENQDSYIKKGELIKVFTECIEGRKTIEFTFKWSYPPDKVDTVTFSPYLISRKIMDNTLIYGFDHIKKECSTFSLNGIVSFQLTDDEYIKEINLNKYEIDYLEDEIIIKSIPELKFDHSMKSLAFKLKPEEKKRQDEIYKILSECIDSYKIVLLHLVWANRKKEKVLFEPFLLGEDFDTSLRGLIVYGRNVIGSYTTNINFKFIKSVEIAVTTYTVDDRQLDCFLYRKKVLKMIPELKILDKPNAQPLADKSIDSTLWTDPDYIKKSCIVCGSFEHCEHSDFLQKHYKEERASWENQRKFSQLLKSTLEHHPKYTVIPYFAENEKNSKKFSSIKRKKWSENYFTLLGEWSQSPVHSGKLTFEIKSTTDRKHWALFQVGFPSRIYAVAEMVDEGDVVMEKVAAGMMSVFTKYEGVYIECWDTIGEVNFSLLYELYDYYNDRFNKEKE